ncbi:MAG TPA: protein-L-isoaspartate O-methyltransferase [Vineibacter sp.]|nr:protein-L-isoaspartate O-methyltransferase [Vineibacter sp.]
MRLSRRAALAGTACLPLIGSGAAARGTADWTFAAYAEAMRASERRTDLTATTFAQVRQRRPHVLQQLETWLQGELGRADPDVMRALAEVPREYFHYDYASNASFARDAYDWFPRAWPIGFGSTLSALLVQAYMTQLAQPKADGAALEIGTGSGYQIALLSRLVRKACSIEIIEPLGRAVSKIFAPLGFDNIETRVGDGYHGWPEQAGGFDVIMVTCAAQHVPPDLLRQLKPGTGRLVVPIGQPFKGEQFLYLFTKDADGRVRSRRDLGVIFIPMTGRISRGG